MILWHWFLHYTGTTDESGEWYAFWSGFGSDLSEFAIVGAILATARHKNCHVRGCWRFGHIDPEVSHPACRRHRSSAAQLGTAPGRSRG